MKRIASTLFLFLINLALYSQNYFVSSTTGNDSNNGQSPATAWASISKAITAAGTGAVIGLKGGDEFYGPVSFKFKDGIVLTSYGSGKAIIKGSKPLGGWTHVGGNIWRATTGPDTVYQVFKNNEPITQARTPVIANTTARSGNYHKITSGSGTVFICSALIGKPNLVGASIHILDYSWTLTKRTITAFNSSTGQISINSTVPGGIAANKEFLINDHYNLLTSQDYWHYDGSGLLYIYSTTMPSNISVTTFDTNGIDMIRSNNIVIENIVVRDFNKAGIHPDGNTEMQIKNTELKYNYEKGVFFEANGLSNLSVTIDKCTFIGGDAGVISWVHNTIVSNSNFYDIGLARNMTKKGYLYCNGYSDFSGTKSTISKNYFYNIGYIGIRFDGPNSLIEKNFINEYGLTKHDGGGIYTWAGAISNPGSQFSVIENNTVILNNNEVGNWALENIYLDDYSHDIMVRYNNVSGGRFGIYLHNTKRITLDNNKSYLGIFGNLHLKEDASIGVMGENIIRNNQCFSNNSAVGKRNLVVQSKFSTLLNFGKYHNNIYYSKFGEKSISFIWNDWKNYVHGTLSEWQIHSKQDLNSTSNLTPWTTEESYFAYNETANVKVITLSTGTWESLTGTTYFGSISLQPYTSEILITSKKSSNQIKADAGKDLSICAGNSTTLTALGGSVYKWSTGATTQSITVSPGTTTTYSVTVSEGTSSGTDEVIVTVNPLPVANAGVDVSIGSGQSTTLTATGGDTYLWSNGETTPSITINPVASTTYEVTVTKNGCTSKDSVIVTVNGAAVPPSTVTADAGKDQTICAGSNAILTASGGSVFKWSTGATTQSITVSPGTTTTYSVTVSEGTSSGTDEVLVTVNPLPVANAGADVSIGSGQSTTLTATGGDTYLWSNGETTPSITINPIASTTYEVTITKNGCTSKDSVIVTVNGAAVPPSTVTADAGKDQTICAGSNATLTASGGSEYKWSTGATTKSITVSPGTTTTYTVTVSEGASSGTDEVLVTVNPLPVANAGADVTINSGQSTTLTATGGDTYLWSNGITTPSITINPISSTTYEVTVTKNGCTAKDSVTVTVNGAAVPPSTVTADAGKDQTICAGNSITLTASGGSVYKWSTGATTQSITVSPNVSTTYSVTVSEGASSDTDEVLLTVNPLPVADAGSNKTIELGQSIELIATGGDNYLWSTGETTQSLMVKPDKSTIYSVTVYQNGCSSSDSVQVTVNFSPPADANAGSDLTICKGESITLNGGGGATYSWSTGANTQNITVSPTRTTTYTLTANRAGTTSTDQVTVTVINCNLNNGLNNSVSGTTGNSSSRNSSDQDDAQVLNKADFELTVYPNPTDGKLNVQTTIPIYNFNLVLMNINGNVIYTDEMDASENGINKEIDLSGFAKGVYLLQLYNAEESYVKKVIVI